LKKYFTKLKKQSINMTNVLGKLAVARLHIKSHPLKKDGRNEFSKYDYFTPELVGKMVNDACIEANIICVFSLKQDSLGFFGEVITTDLETGESVTTETRTAKPNITATNETQQMGGMNTYCKRYALMSLFDIEDNTIDFDSQDNRKSAKPTGEIYSSTNNKKPEDNRPWLNEGEILDKAIAKLKAGTTSIQKIKEGMKVSKAIEAKLLAAIQ
jgi:hypothetical protein